MRLPKAVIIAFAVVAFSREGAAQEGSQQHVWNLASLMASLREVKSATGEFTERKTLHVLTAPLITTGTLSYVAPDKLEKVTRSPTPERFVLDGRSVTLTTGPEAETHRFSLADYPQIAGLVEGIRATLAGDLATLSRFYTVQLTGDASNWQLLLQPRDSDLTHFVKVITITGRNDQINRIDSEENDGDHSEMTILETVGDAH